MAQLRDLIVNGASRFLGVVNFNNEAIFNEGVTLNETLTLLKDTDAVGSSYAAPALVIGPYTAQHLEFDTNEIMSKSAAGTPTTLYLNNDGGQVVIGKDGLKVGDGTAATAKNTGDLQVSGGLSTTAASFFGAGVTIDSTLSVTGNATIGDATSDVHKVNGNLTHNGIVYFANGTTYYVNASGNAKFNTLTSVGNTTLGDSATGDTIAINGVTTITGATKVVGVLTAQGNIIPSANNTYDLGSSTYKWKNLYVNTVAYIGDGTDASSTTTGVARISGGLGVTKSGYFGGSVTATDYTGTKLTLNNTATAGNGIYLYRNNGTADEALRINVDGSNGTITNINETLQSILNLVLEYKDTSNSGAGAGSKTIEFKATSSGSQISANHLIADGNLQVNGNATIGNATSDAHTIKGGVTLTGHLIPGTTTTYDLGSSSKYWKKLYVGNGDDSTSTTTGVILANGGIAATKNITVGGQLSLNRKTGTGSGRISFYDPSYKSWYIYMSNPGDGQCPSGGHPSSYGEVTAWALRSLVETTSAKTYGWIWESVTNTTSAAASTEKPTPMMALSSATGNLQLKGNATIDGGTVNLGSAKTYYVNTGTSKLNALTTVGQITAGSHVIPDANNANDLGSSSSKWKDLYVAHNIVVGSGDGASAANTGNVQITGGLSATQNSYFDAQVIIKKAVMEYDTSDECLYFSFKA